MPRITPIHWQPCVDTKPGVARPIVIPLYRAVPVFIIVNNLRTAGLSRDDYFTLLERT